eukprot:CAMPEP_0173434734 /NCGR_PEP_ID=MMETSP1357-20121228/13289_1 /TAXON_ID=77926 /ORGANISM="Hemiselmis rufescens, Strain PCC563" /LENGTH=78 /DNA_ID=CAMNT_0014399629 /DNA_START=38 /DNA_END=271 /DNA_ORIENTATION=-
MTGYGDQQQLYPQDNYYEQPGTWQQPQYVVQQPQTVGPSYGQDAYGNVQPQQQYAPEPYIPYDQGPPTVQQPQTIPPP